MLLIKDIFGVYIFRFMFLTVALSINEIALIYGSTELLSNVIILSPTFSRVYLSAYMPKLYAPEQMIYPYQSF